MKWKYADRLTIDFRFKILSDGRYVFSVVAVVGLISSDRHSFTVGAGRNKETEIRDFDMSAENFEKLLSDIKKTRNHREAIIECAFDAAKYVYPTISRSSDFLVESVLQGLQAFPLEIAGVSFHSGFS